MNAMAIRGGLACWLCFPLFAAALYGQDATDDASKPKDSQTRAVAEEKTANEEYVRKLRAELKARLAEFAQMEANWKQAEKERAMLAAELRKLRESFEAVASEKKLAAENAQRQAAEMAATMQRMIYQQSVSQAQNTFTQGDQPKDESLPDRLESARKSLEEAARATAAGAMKRAAETLAQASQQAEGAASKLDQAKRDPNDTSRHDVASGWEKLLRRADRMLTQTRRNEEAATTFLPKLESAVTQLRKVGRNEEADQLQAEARVLLGEDRPETRRERNEARPEMSPRDRRPHDQPGAGGGVERAVDELRREVEQLRREVRDLRRSLQRSSDGNESSRQEGRQRGSSHEQGEAPEFVNIGSRATGEILHFGGEGRSIRVGDRVKKGDVLMVLWSKDLADQVEKLTDAQKRLDADARVCEQIEAVGPGTVPARQLIDARRTVEADKVALKDLKNAVRSWPLRDEVVAERVRALAEDPTDAQRATVGEWRVEAPVSGTLIERNISLGDLVSRGDVLFRIKIDQSERNETRESQ